MFILEATTQLSFWGPIVFFCIGVPAALFNIIIFIGFKTFRKSPSAYYVVGQSLLDVSVLLLVLLPVISSVSTSVSSTVCKLGLFLAQVTVSGAMSFLCLTAFDRWACTSRSARVRRLNSNHIARYLVLFTFLFWSLVNIPYLIFCDLIPPTYVCFSTNDVFTKIVFYFLAPIFSTVFPLLVLIIFIVLTHRNIRLIAHIHDQQQPVRTRSSMWEQQMTRMMVAQTILSIFCTLPRAIFYTYSAITLEQNATKSFNQISIELLVDQLTISIMSINFVSSFYIYFLFSPRLRQTIKIHLKSLCHLTPNQVVPIDNSLTIAQNRMRHH
ncbi:unnamed protein product [Adineta steineri]|uniref:G-protein coupled receptors family 1 profile domain-containing protein n=1 Tax=Adineta steineri TaxID=433720 RepID=A0A816A434_9BILA|nr:unnamed protein product [Adineta steineri]CAF1593090.1 unnamed protein product [Adineta steineri]